MGPEKATKENAELGLELVRTILNNEENQENIVNFISLAIRSDIYWSAKTIYGLVSIVNIMMAMLKTADGTDAQEILDRISDMISELE